MTILWIILAVIGLVLLWLIIVYNRLIGLKNRTAEAWSDITVQLKRRYDLIPNLVEAVKGYAKHEKGVFEAVTKARAEAISAKAPAEKAKAENMLTDALKSVFAVAENYPALRASENFMALQGELAETENKIESSRRFYNANVRDMSIAMEVFPTNIFAKKLGFTKQELFQMSASEAAEAEKAPKVNFDEDKK